jgi:hypothetical protein
MGFKDHFFPLKPMVKPPAMPHIIAFDTEDNSLGAPHNFICGCVYEGADPIQQYVFWNRDAMRKHIFDERRYATIGVAHNLAYDLWNIDYPENTCELINGKSKLIGATYKYGKRQQMRFLDTGNFFIGASIHSLGEQLGYQKIGCKCEQHDFNDNGICPTCGMFSVHYLKNKRQCEIQDDTRQIIAEYCMRDAEICYRTMKKIIDMTYMYKTRFKCFTAASLAMRIFRTNFMKGRWKKRSMKINDIERLSYYGGRTEAFDYRMHESVFAEDIRSSYPSAMMKFTYPYPVNPIRVIYTLDEALKHEGISLVTVRVPLDMHIPPLPYRREDGRLLFPVGTWTAAFTHPEIKMAIKHGVEILEIHESLIYSNTFSPFKDFVGTFYKLKDSTKGIEREFYKLLLNCFSDDTTILTKDGHKNIKDVKTGDLVYSMNPSTLETEFKPVVNTFSYCYFGDMVHINSGKKIDMLVTPNHKMFMQPDNQPAKKFDFIEAKDITYHHFPSINPISGISPNTISLDKYVRNDESILDPSGQHLWSPPHAKHKKAGVPMIFKTADMLELAGWYISEGCIVQNGITISQSMSANKKNCHNIEELLMRMGLRYQSHSSKHNVISYTIFHRLIQEFMLENFGRYSEGVYIASSIFEYDSSLLHHLFISMMKGDGCLSTKSDKSSQTLKYTTKSYQLAKDFQRLCIHLGLLSRVHYEHHNI